VRRIFLLFILIAAGTAHAQQPVPSPNPGKVDPTGEIDKLSESCGAFKIPDCAEELFTGKPVHIAVGSIAPQNGFGGGVAYVGGKPTTDWITSWDFDAIGSINGSWRAGAYIKLVHTPVTPGVGVGFGTPPPSIKPNLMGLPEHPVINLYAQTISLNKLTYFGLGPHTTLAGRTFYGMRETIVGVSAVKPFYEKLNASLYGEVNGRFVALRPSHNQASPSIETLYNEATAPGLIDQPSTIQLGEGIRMRPLLFNDYLRLNYDLNYKQYFAPGNSSFSFQRLTFHLSHEIPIYKDTTRNLLPRDANGPDDCSLDPSASPPECPKAYVRNREGTIGFLIHSALSMTPGGNIVPFYYQPTLGGSDIDGNTSLPSYQDFRFRAPNVLFFRESFEHSIFSLPLGFAFMADQGKVALNRGDLGPNPWLHSFSTGLTLRAGGFPQVYLLFSWGGSEGTHTSASVNSSLLGGSSRPSLF
jgi:hypothetical protein